MLRLTINGTSWMAFRDALASFEPFRTSGNLLAVSDSVWDTARLPEPYRSEYRERREHITYTVMSYATPLAWYDDERGWIMPDVKYSVTTSRAQRRIRPAIHELQQVAV